MRGCDAEHEEGTPSPRGGRDMLSNPFGWYYNTAGRVTLVPYTGILSWKICLWKPSSPSRAKATSASLESCDVFILKAHTSMWVLISQATSPELPVLA